ncbi:hypothetical protein JKF63_06849 [Porcisia hertigi]|uniref:Mon2 C-terminal domain-containing protein n=1 Tax=Porcisia hertigi TaxID=2761500 RepID=A0A836LJ81_9TRYP|nr:hypothetical protein JKF63_06849 [Porcisia hertigi]
MASYWWPLPHFTNTPETAGSTSSSTPALTHSSLPKDNSGRTTAAAMHESNATTAADARHLVHAVFHLSLENLLVESTKHRSLVLLRDAIQNTRQRQYDPVSLFDTLCIACILLAGRCAGDAGTTTRRNQSNAPPPTGNSNGASCDPATAAEAVSLPTTGAHGLHYRYHPSSRALLLQCIGDIGKLIALALLPVTEQVGRRVADLVRELAFQSSSTTASPGQHLPPTPPLPARPTPPPPVSKTGTPMLRPLSPQSHTASRQDREPSSGLIDTHLSSGAAPSATATATATVSVTQLVHDDQVLLRLLQMIASAVSSCSLGNSALADLCSVLLLFFSGVEPKSMLEATCEATLAHHIHTVLTALHDSGASDDGATTSAYASDEKSGRRSSLAVTLTAPTFTAQLQGVAFIKDICRLVVGARTRWLRLSSDSSAPYAPDGAAGGGGNTIGAVSGKYSNKRDAAAAQQQQQRPSGVQSLAPSLVHESVTASETCGHDGAEKMLSTPPEQLEKPRCAAAKVMPERLRMFLVRTVTQFVKERAKVLTDPAVAATSADASLHSPLYAQCLNDCFFSVAVWGLHEIGITVSMQPPPALFMEVQQQRGDSACAPRCSLKMFTCTQQLALVSINTHLCNMTYFTQVLFVAHEQLLQRLFRRRKPAAAMWFASSGEVSECKFVCLDDAQRMYQTATEVLSLWRKMLTSAPLFWKLLQLRSVHRGRRDDTNADAVSEDTEGCRGNGLYGMSDSQARPEEDQDNPYCEENVGDTGDGGGSVGALQRQSKSSLDVSSNSQLPWIVRSRSRESHLMSSQRTYDGSFNNENERAGTPPVPGLSNAAAIDGEGGTGVEDTAVPSLVRFMMSVLALVVSHMQRQATTITTTSLVRAGDTNIDDKDRGRHREEAEDTAHAEPLPRDSSSTHRMFSGDAADDVLRDPSRKRSSLHIAPAAVNASDAATAVSTPLCLCMANASSVYQCFTEALNCLTAFGQLFAQLVDTQLAPSVATADRDEVLCRCRAYFLALHPHLLHCEQLCLRYLRYEEDLLPVVLKATGYWVQVSCILELPEERDSYLGALVDVLRAQDAVANHLVALAPLSASGVSDTTSPTTTMLLEALIALDNECAAADLTVPGSVAAALLNPSDDCDAVSPEKTDSATTIRQRTLNVSKWGIGWLLRRDHPASILDNTTIPARTGTTGTGGGTVTSPDPHMSITPAAKRGAAVVARTALPAPTCSDTLSVTASTSQSEELLPTPAPSALVSRGWRAPAVQHAVILCVCRLQHKVAIMKTLHTIANTLGPHLKTGWSLLARGLVVTELLLHMLKHLLSWIEEGAEEQEYHKQLLNDSLHLRDALRSLCLHNTCHLPYDQFDIFFAEFVNETVGLTAAALSPTQGRPALVLNDWASGLPLHNPQGCVDQWVLTSECLSLSLLAILPFMELRYTDATNNTSAEDTVGGSGLIHRPGVQALQLQHQRTGALARALRLWELETGVCSYVTDHDRVTEWGTALLTTMRAHKDALLAAVASSATGGAATDPDTVLFNGSLPQETGNIEPVLSTIVSHVSVVAVQLCRSASRRRVGAAVMVASAGGAGGGPFSETNSAVNRLAPSAAAPSSYQAVQSASLVLTSGPFAMVPLTQTANTLFAASGSSLVANGGKDSLGGADGVSRLPLLPFAQQEAAQSISGLLSAVHCSAQAIAIYTSLDDSNSSSLMYSSTATPAKLDPLEQLLASPFALLDRIYHQWQRRCAGSPSGGGEHGGQSRSADAGNPRQTAERHAASSVIADAVSQLLANTAAAVLMDVVKIVQSYGEDIEGAAWEAILSLLQRTSMVTTEHGNVAMSSSSVASERSRSAGPLRAPSRIKPHATTAGAATAFSSQAVEALNTAFRALESIQHNHIPNLSIDGLHCLIVCVGAFTVHRVDGGATGERKLHTNLSAVQLLWSIADYLAAFGSGAAESLERCGDDKNTNASDLSAVNVTTADGAGAASGREVLGSLPRSPEGSPVPQKQQQQDRLWCSLLWQLRNGCLDDRQEVGQSALQTFFALVQTYGGRFSAACWRCVLEDVLLPIMEVVAVATELCATPSSSTLQSASSGDSAKVEAAAVAERYAQDATIQRLLRSFMDNPPQLEAARVALFNAGGRLFVTHYAHMHAPAATPALELFLRLCGDVCVVVRGTSGEHAAMAAVHAVHGLLVEMPGQGLHAHAVDLAWRALERLILRGGDYSYTDKPPADVIHATLTAPYAHTQKKQCTLSVVAAVVAAVCDSFRLQRLVTTTAAATPCSPVTTTTAASATSMGHSHSPRGISSYFTNWSGGTCAATPDSSGSTPDADLRHGGSSLSAQYFTRLLFLLEATTRCPAVVDSYYFPSKAQTTLLEGVTAVWPTLSSREARRMWCEVLLPAFPSAAQLQSFVLQDSRESASIMKDDPAPNTASTATTTTTSAVLHLKSVMPPGSHPGYLSAVMETMRNLMVHHMGSDVNRAMDANRTESDKPSPALIPANASAATSNTPATSTEEDLVRLLFMAPSTLQIIGTLLLLHLASAEALSAPPPLGSLPFTLPALFLQDCVSLVQYTLWGPVLAPLRPPPGSQLSNVLSGTEVAAQCRRDGVAALCSVFELLLTTTSTLVRHLDETAQMQTAVTSGAATAPTTTIVPPHVTEALQSLDLLVDTLGQVVHVVMERFEDVVCATAAITSLSKASTAEGMALARVARRSVLLLQHWADAVVAAPSVRLPSQSSTAMSHHDHEHHHPRSGSDAADAISAGGQDIATPHRVSAQCPHTGSGPPAIVLSTATSHSQLRDVARASMVSRNKATVAQFLANPGDASAGALLLETLRDMLRILQPDPQLSSQTGSAAAKQHLSAMTSELLRLVAWCSIDPIRSDAAITREKEIHEMLSKLLAIALGEPQQKQLSWPSGPDGQHGSRQVDNAHDSNAKGEDAGSLII